jgi:hypothetical protein
MPIPASIKRASEDAKSHCSDGIPPTCQLVLLSAERRAYGPASAYGEIHFNSINGIDGMLAGPGAGGRSKARRVTSSVMAHNSGFGIS